MDKAQVIWDGERQMVVLPEMYQISGQEVYISRSGRALVLTPVEESPAALPAADDPWAILRTATNVLSAPPSGEDRE